MRHANRVALFVIMTLLAATAQAQPEKFVAVWAASAHGPYPVGNATAQPELKFAFPSAEKGAADQTFRMIVRPDLWGTRARIRLSNAFGTKPVVFDGIYIGLQASGGTVLPGTNHPVMFARKPSVTVAPGNYVTSDAIALPFSTPANAMLIGRRLAISFHVAGESGPMTWHAKGLTTSYLGAPGGGSHGKEVDDAALPFSTTSWYFLDAVEMQAPADTRVIVAFGDSITDGTASTLNGDDRWPDAFARRLHAAAGDRFAVVNAGIGGNQVIGPAEYSPTKPFSGGPAATERLERDLISLPGVAEVIWLEGINDFSAGASADAVIAGVRATVQRLRARIPGVRITMATLTSALHSTNGVAGSAEVETKRQAYNKFIRTTDIFDNVADFDAATLDPKTGELKEQYQPNSTTGGPGDKLHPNRAGYAGMGKAIDLNKIMAK
jgi:lysophospholipase L1-like esterase